MFFAGEVFAHAIATIIYWLSFSDSNHPASQQPDKSSLTTTITTTT